MRAYNVFEGGICGSRRVMLTVDFSQLCQSLFLVVCIV
jgi:hypothetical protein